MLKSKCVRLHKPSNIIDYLEKYQNATFYDVKSLEENCKLFSKEYDNNKIFYCYCILSDPANLESIIWLGIYEPNRLDALFGGIELNQQDRYLFDSRFSRQLQKLDSVYMLRLDTRFSKTAATLITTCLFSKKKFFSLMVDLPPNYVLDCLKKLSKNKTLAKSLTCSALKLLKDSPRSISNRIVVTKEIFEINFTQFDAKQVLQ